MKYQLKSQIGSYKYLTFLAMLYVTIALCSLVLAQRASLIFGLTVMGASLIYPLTFSLSDIMTEVYNYQNTKRIILFSFLLQFIFAFMCLGIINLDSPSFFLYDSHYKTVLGNLLRIAGGSFVAAVIGIFLNVHLLWKLKVKFSGHFFLKFFLVRSLISSIIGEFIYTVIAVLSMFFGKMPLSAIVVAITSSMCVKVISNLLTAIPAAITVLILKKAEDLGDFDHEINFQGVLLSEK